MELRRWRYFAVLAEEMHFTRAARRLFIAQPALSQQIKRFEADLGAALIERHGPTFQLTEAGRVAAAQAVELVARVDAARELVVAASRGFAGVLRVAYTRSAPGPPASTLIGSFRERHPAVEVRLETGWTSHNLRELIADRLDAAFVRPPIDARGVSCVTFASEELLVALPAEHPLAARRRLRPEQLRGEPVVFWPRANGPGMHDLITSQVWPDEPPNVVREEPEDEQLLNAVAAGAGIAVVPAGRARAQRIPGLALRRFSPPVPQVLLGLAYRAETTNPGVRELLDLIETERGASPSELYT